MFDPEGYWTPAEAASALATWGAQGKLPADWGFVPDGQSRDILDQPNEVTAAHLIGRKLAAGSVQAWARDVLRGFPFSIPARCWSVEPSLYNVFKGDSVKMSQIGYPGLSVDISAEVYLNTAQLLSCLGLEVVDPDPSDPQSCNELAADAVETAQTCNSANGDIVASERGGSRYRAFCAVATASEFEHFRRKPSTAPQRDLSKLVGKSVGDVAAKWFASLETKSFASSLTTRARKSSGPNYEKNDAPLVRCALAGIESGEYTNPWDAALALAKDAVGKGEIDSKVKRLSGRIVKAFDEGRSTKRDTQA